MAMATVTPFRRALTRNDPKRLQMFRQTVGKKLRGAEIDEAVEWCEVYEANPFTKDIYFFVFDADDPVKRRVVPVIGIGLYRKIAARTGNYRPDELPPRFRYDETLKNAANPLGIIDCEMTVYRHSHGAWHPFTSRVKWDERAPIIEDGDVTWVPIPGKFHPDGHKQAGKPICKRVVGGNAVRKLDPNKSNWLTMGETMLAKATEADALRRGWPENLSGSYSDGELDRHEVIDGTATEIIERADTEDRQRLLGGKDAVTVDWSIDGTSMPLERVPDGAFFDRAVDWMRAPGRTAMDVKAWVSRNKPGLQDYWGRNGNDALELKKLREARIAELEAAT